MGSRTSMSARCMRLTRRMALQAARDIYTRRGEGLSIWVVPSNAITASDPVRKGHDVRAGGVEDLPASDVLRRAGRSRAYVILSRHCERSEAIRSAPQQRSVDCFVALLLAMTAKRSELIHMAIANIQVSETPLVLYALRRADDALILGPPSVGMVRPRADAGRGYGARQYGASTCSARRASSIATPPGSRARTTTRTSSPICATSGSTAICCWSSSRTAISPAPWCGNSSTPPSPISIGAR